MTLAKKSGFTLKGTKKMQRAMRNVGGQVSDQAKGALRLEGEQIMTRSKREFVPVDLGALRSSGHVQEPVRSGRDVSVTLAYGGPAAPYAVVQHESLHFSHRVGGPKYLERPMRDAQKGMAQRLAAKIRPRDARGRFVSKK